MVAVPSFQDKSSELPPAANEADEKFPPPTIRCPNEPVEVDEPLTFTLAVGNSIAASETVILMSVDEPAPKFILSPLCT